MSATFSVISLVDAPEVGAPAHVRMAKMVHLDTGLWSQTGMCSDFWRLYNNRDAGAFVTVAGERHDLLAGRSYVIPNGTTFDSCNDAPIRHLFVHFDAPGLVARGLVELEPDPAVDALALRVHDDLSRDPRAPGLQRRLTSFLHAALAQLLDRSVAVATHHDPALSPALRHIDTHLTDPLPNRALARLCHLSEDHFIRRFREHIGTTPAAYVRRQRVAEAAYRLLYTSRAVEAIAADLGFGSRCSFDRTFQAMTGVTPAEYRRTMSRA